MPSHFGEFLEGYYFIRARRQDPVSAALVHTSSFQVIVTVLRNISNHSTADPQPPCRRSFLSSPNTSVSFYEYLYVSFYISLSFSVCIFACMCVYQSLSLTPSVVLHLTWCLLSTPISSVVLACQHVCPPLIRSLYIFVFLSFSSIWNMKVYV